MNYLNDNKTESADKKSEQRKVELTFPLLTIRTQLFNGVFDRLGAFRFSRFLSWVALVIVPIIASIGLYLLVNSLVGLLWDPAVTSAAREAGPGAFLLLPGITPYLPIVYGWFAIFCAIAIHEGAHGIAARSLGLKVKSSGLLFILFFPLGAFVDVDEEELKKASGKISSRVLAGGVGGNIALAVVCFIGILLIVGGLAPVVDGVYLGSISEGMPAEAAGLLPGDVLVSIDGILINSTDNLRTSLDNKTSGDLVKVTVARGDLWQNQYSTIVNLTMTDNRTVMGIGVVDLMAEQRLEFYKAITPQNIAWYIIPPALASGFVPFSNELAPFYASWLGPQWTIYANILFWIWFVNINVALFNALPIYPLDGGRMLNIALKKTIRRRNSEKLSNAITAFVTASLIIILILIISIIFIIPNA